MTNKDEAFLGMRSFIGSLRGWRLLTALAISLPVLILFWDLVFAGRVVFWGTPLMQFVPWYRVAINAVAGGEMPMWNPLVGNGAPLLANLQSAVLYPPNWLHLLASPPRVMSLLLVAHVAWAGIGMLAFCRSLQLPRLAGLVSGLSFMLSGYLNSRLGFVSIGFSVPWLPWLFWASERAAQRRRLADYSLLGAVFGMQLLAGHAQTSFYSGLAVAGYLLWRSRPLRVNWRGMAFGVLSLSAGLGLAAAQLVPTAEFLVLSQRAGGVTRDLAMQYSLWPWRVVAFFAPRFFGHPATGDYWGFCCNYWEDNGYIGLLPVLLAISSAVAWPRLRRSGPDGWIQTNLSSLVPFFALMAVCSVVLALGIHTPIYPFVFDYVPGFGQFQAPARLLILWTFSSSCLAGVGVTLWIRAPKSVTLGRLITVLGLAFLIAAGASRPILGGAVMTFVPAVAQLGATLVALGCLVLIEPSPSRPSRFLLWSAGVLVLVAADLVSANWGANPTVDRWLYDQPTTSAVELEAAGVSGRLYYPKADEHTVTFDQYLSFRSFQPHIEADQASADGYLGPSAHSTEVWFGLREALIPNASILDGLHSANNLDPLLSERYTRLMTAIERAEGDRRLKLLQMMGVEVLAATEPVAGLELLHANRQVSFFRLPDPLPRAYLVFSAGFASNQAEALEAITDPSFDARRKVIIERGAPVTALPVSARPIQDAVILTSTNNTVRIRADMPEDGYLVLLDGIYPGWSAQVDDRPSDIYAANLAFRAVAVPAGEHEISFAYQPWSVTAGLLISGFTLLIIVGLNLIQVRRRMSK